MSCKVCRGTGLQPFFQHGIAKVLFTDAECEACGGKGYQQGGRRYHVAVFRNGERVASIDVLARTAADALKGAAEMIADAMEEKGRADLMAAGEALGLEVTE
jgi:hypothetical protein